jgi:uncharacterized membrane protein YjdF
MGIWNDISESHERLKKRIHTFKMPLSPIAYRVVMVCYLTIPIIGGYYTMQYTNTLVEKNLGKQGSKLRDPYSVHESTHAQNTALQQFLNEHRRKKERS